MRAFAIVLVLALAGPAAHAQPGNTPPSPGRAEKRRERIKTRIRALRAAALVEALGDQVTAKLLPILAHYDDEFDRLLQDRAEIERKLAQVAAAADGRTADKVVDEAVANQRAFRETEDHRLGELRKVLTPPQVAKLLVVLPPLERRIQNQLRNAIEKGQKRAPRERRDDDLDDEDDTPAPPPAPAPVRRPR